MVNRRMLRGAILTAWGHVQTVAIRTRAVDISTKTAIIDSTSEAIIASGDGLQKGPVMAQAHKKLMSKTDVGAKVNVKLHGPKGPVTPAVVLETAYSHEGNYKQCRLKIAQYSQLSGKWIVSMHPKPVQSYKLTVRKEVIAELDNEQSL